PVEQGKQTVALGEKGAGPTHFEVHEAREVGALRWPWPAEPGRAAEFRQVVRRKIGAAALGVLPDVPEDVGELEREAERVGILGRAFGAARPRYSAEHAEGETTDGAGHTAAVDLQVVPGLVGL